MLSYHKTKSLTCTELPSTQLHVRYGSICRLRHQITVGRVGIHASSITDTYIIAKTELAALCPVRQTICQIPGWHAAGCRGQTEVCTACNIHSDIICCY